MALAWDLLQGSCLLSCVRAAPLKELLSRSLLFRLWSNPETLLSSVAILDMFTGERNSLSICLDAQE